MNTNAEIEKITKKIMNEQALDPKNSKVLCYGLGGVSINRENRRITLPNVGSNQIGLSLEMHLNHSKTSINEED
jgi:hypothetical protein